MFITAQINLILIFFAALGLIIGSFLNVVIVRYPKMFMHAWRAACLEHLSQPAPEALSLSLASPASHCPTCHKRLRWWHNIPLLSYIFLRGRCAFCQKHIPIVYCAIELLTAFLTAAAVAHFGLTLQAIYALLFIWILIPLTMIDYKTTFLPDTLTLPLLWLGLIVNISHHFTSLSSAVLGAVMGYSLLWVVAYAFKAIRKKEGIGHGDFKLLAALGAWFGLTLVPLMLLIAVFSCLIISIISLLRQKITRDTLIPFGPFLGLAGMLALFYGGTLMRLITQFLLGS